MSEEKIGNRNLVVIGAIIVQLCLGSIYAWSIFQGALYETIVDGGMYEWDKFWSNLPFAAGLASFAVFMKSQTRLMPYTRIRAATISASMYTNGCDIICPFFILQVYSIGGCVVECVHALHI